MRLKMVKASCKAFLWCLLAVFMCVGGSQLVFAQKDAPDPEKIKSRIMEMKAKKLVEMLELSGDQKSKFLADYEAGQRNIDDAKKYLDLAVRKLNKMLKDGSDAEIAAATDEVMKNYDALVSAQKDRITQLKAQLSVEQYAKLTMFEIRFPDVLQRLIMRRGMINNAAPKD